MVKEFSKTHKNTESVRRSITITGSMPNDTEKSLAACERYC